MFPCKDVLNDLGSEPRSFSLTGLRFHVCVIQQPMSRLSDCTIAAVADSTLINWPPATNCIIILLRAHALIWQGININNTVLWGHQLC